MNSDIMFISNILSNVKTLIKTSVSYKEKCIYNIN